MGWNIYLHSNQQIKEQEIDDIVQQLPTELRGPWEKMDLPMKKPNGGWQTATDIDEPKGNTLQISGSYSFSGHIAEDMAKHLQQEFEKKGHTIFLEPRW